MKKLALASILALFSAVSMAAVVTSGGEPIKNAFGEVWQTPTSK